MGIYFAYVIKEQWTHRLPDKVILRDPYGNLNRILIFQYQIACKLFRHISLWRTDSDEHLALVFAASGSVGSASMRRTWPRPFTALDVQSHIYAPSGTNQHASDQFGAAAEASGRQTLLLWTGAAGCRIADGQLRIRCRSVEQAAFATEAGHWSPISTSGSCSFAGEDGCNGTARTSSLKLNVAVHLETLFKLVQYDYYVTLFFRINIC